MKIPLFKMYYENDDVEAVSDVVRRGSYWALGPEIERFEKRIADLVGRKYALTFNSGTSALHTLLLAYDVKGKEVIVPSFTFIATSNTVVLAGGKPVFAETEWDTLGLDVEDVRKKITKNTKAIIPLHYGGSTSKHIEELRKLAKEHGILLIEDAAESLGSSYKGKKAGTFGDSAMFSFCQNKVIATGEGGIIVTDDEEIFEKCKLYRSHGRVELKEDYFSSTKDNDYIIAGYNYRMPAMIAALGISQLNKMEKIVEMRTKIAKKYDHTFRNIKRIRLMDDKENYSVHQMYTIILENEKTRNALQEHLLKEGIMTKIYFCPVHLKTLYKRDWNYKEGDLPKTEELSNRVLSLPIYPTLSENETEHIVNSVANFFK